MAKIQIKSEKLTPLGGIFSISILQLSFKESIFTGIALQLLYHKNGGGGMSRVTKALRNMPEAMTLIHGSQLLLVLLFNMSNFNHINFLNNIVHF